MAEICHSLAFPASSQKQIALFLYTATLVLHMTSHALIARLARSFGRQRLAAVGGVALLASTNLGYHWCLPMMGAFLYLALLPRGYMHMVSTHPLAKRCFDFQATTESRSNKNVEPERRLMPVFEIKIFRRRPVNVVAILYNSNLKGKRMAIGIFQIVVVLIVFVLIVLAASSSQRKFEENWPPIDDDEFVRRCQDGTDRETALKVRRIISEQLGIEYNRVYPEQNFVDDLDCR